METSTKHQEDFVPSFEKLAIRETPSPPAKEPSPEPEQPRSIFSFLDDPGFQESDPALAPAPENPSGEFQGYGLFPMAVNPEGSKILKKHLELGMYVQETFNEVFPFIFALMSNQNGRQIFETLIQFCNPIDLGVLMDKFLSEKLGFLAAAQCEPGSKSIQAFAARLKVMSLEKLEADLTSILLLEFAKPIMTHKYGWHIYKQCFTLFGDGPNHILYNIVLAHFDKLVMDPTGVLVINAAMDNVRGNLRRDLMSVIITLAPQLSFDPSGNYVLQHCLGLRNEEVNAMICMALRGNFVVLAQKQYGSFVVEKCLEFSEFGRGLVLAEIFKDNKTLMMLAKHGHGNYVVQMALETTKVCDQVTYEKMIKVLQPRFPILINLAASGNRRRREC